jgi:hypothetical protein
MREKAREVAPFTEPKARKPTPFRGGMNRFFSDFFEIPPGY